MSSKGLTKRDMSLLSRALSDAMNDRASYADSWTADAPESKQARNLVRDYEALHVKMFGTPSRRQQDIDQFAKWDTVELIGGRLP